MNAELDNLVAAFVRYYNGRLRELCDEVGQKGLFENYAFTYGDDDDGSAAASKRQKLAESERVNTQLEEIFAARKIPMMPCAAPAGSETHAAEPAQAPRLEAATASRSGVVARDPRVAAVVAAEDTLSIENLRSIVEAFASRRGIHNYTPRF